jgi:hypothetical protein
MRRWPTWTSPGKKPAWRTSFGFRMRRKAYRTYAHSNVRIDELVGASGLQLRSEDRTFFWRIVVYDRAITAPMEGSTAYPFAGKV